MSHSKRLLYNCLEPKLSRIVSHDFSFVSNAVVLALKMEAVTCVAEKRCCAPARAHRVTAQNNCIVIFAVVRNSVSLVRLSARNWLDET